MSSAGVVAAKATTSSLLILFSKNEIENIGEGIGKKVLLEMAQKYTNEGAISKEVFEGLQNLEEKELAAALKSALTGQISPSQLAFLSKLDDKVKKLIWSWDNEKLLKLEFDLAENPKFAEEFFEKAAKNPDLVESWKVVKSSGFDDLARNTDVLDEVLKLQSKSLNGNPLDVQKLFDNGFGKTLNNLSDADKTKMLARMNEWGADKVDDLARRLGKGNYPELADDLTNPDFFKLDDDIIHDPENAIDIAKRAGDGNLFTTAKSTFFNNVTQLGKDFEKVVAPALKPGGAWRNKLKTLLKDKFGVDDLDSYEMFEQVQLTYNKSGDYFIADQAFVKYGFDADGDKFIENIIIVENKLSDATKLTGNQSAARNISNYTVRSKQISGLEQGLEVGNSNWVRAYGDGTGKNIVDITDEFN